MKDLVGKKCPHCDHAFDECIALSLFDGVIEGEMADDSFLQCGHCGGHIRWINKQMIPIDKPEVLDFGIGVMIGGQVEKNAPNPMTPVITEQFDMAELRDTIIHIVTEGVIQTPREFAAGTLVADMFRKIPAIAAILPDAAKFQLFNAMADAPRFGTSQYAIKRVNEGTLEVQLR